MNNLAELYEKQKTTGEEIDQLYRNYKKDSASRKTEDYLTRRLGTLTKAWDNFNLNNTIITSLEYKEEHPYIKNKYYDGIKKVYEEMKASIRENLDKSSKALPTQHPTGFPSISTIETENSKDVSSQQKGRFKTLDAKINGMQNLISGIDSHFASNYGKAFFQQKIRTLDAYWKDITALNDDIIFHATEDDMECEYFVTNKYYELEAVYDEKITMLQERCNEHNLLNDSSINHNTETLPRLPRINIPTFNGNYTSWRSFHDIFYQTIHENKTLGNAQKMHYLKTSIIGEASHLISHLQITNEDYDTAWNILTQRYDNRRVIFSTYMQNIISQPNIHSESSYAIKKMHDVTRECLHAIHNLKIDTTNWDPMIIHLLIQKLDKETHKLYEQSLQNPRDLQKLEHFFNFLESRFRTLEAIKSNKHQNLEKGHTYNRPEVKHSIQQHHSSTESACHVCKTNEHTTYGCPKVREATPPYRLIMVKNQHLCINCLRDTHQTRQCPSRSSCRICNKKHHTLLHDPNIKRTNKKDAKENAVPVHCTQVGTDNTSEEIEVQSHLANVQFDGILLATAIIKYTTETGQDHFLRALIDQGSQASFITEETVQTLNIPRERIYASISGVGHSTAGVSKSIVQVNIKPRSQSTFVLPIQALVLKRLTKNLPGRKIPYQEWEHLKNLLLADPSYNKPGPINIILGADVFAKIIMTGIIKGKPGTPIAQQTKFGWIISGGTSGMDQRNDKIQINSLIARIEIEEQLRKFWELEETPMKRILTAEEEACEKFFEENHTRAKDGRYIVRLPIIKKDSTILGESRGGAITRLLQMERRFMKNNSLWQQYSKCINEYLELGHMKPALTKEGDHIDSSTNSYNTAYLPHHAVIKESSSTTKLRVVFDASRKSKSGISLNDKLMVGPTIQEDMAVIIMRWRTHKIALTADIEKMYRQIRVTDEDSNYQRIVWRANTQDRIKDYCLTTLTFGTASAPYLAIRTLQQLAKDEERNYPLASKIAVRDFYVDDLITGCDDISTAHEMLSQMNSLMKSGGFELRKWACNHSPILEDISPENRELQTTLIMGEDDTIKTLGLYWHTVSDHFSYKVKLSNANNIITKRSFLSEAAKLFDPLGWIAPTTIIAKLLFQKLWLAGLDWDDKLPKDLHQEWQQYRDNLPKLEQLVIPRWIHTHRTNQQWEIHGFSDASNVAYAAVVYVRVVDSTSQIHTQLITAKTKVAPIKPVTLPRLELCGAVLLAKLIKKVQEALQAYQVAKHAWTDSTIVLAWLRGHPSKWKTFIANRTAEIHEVLNCSEWNHVATEDNPADCATRGVGANELEKHPLWWTGPKWLKKPREEWPITNMKYEATTELEKKKQPNLIRCLLTTQGESIWDKYSSYTKLLRIVAWCLRFISNCKTDHKKINVLTSKELQTAEVTILKLVQAEEFAEEIEHLKRKRDLRNNSSLRSLHPYIDQNELLRVGGRLQHADISNLEKNPIIIPHKHHVTTLIITRAHNCVLHGGNSLTLANVRLKYWLIRGHSAVKAFIHKCIRCSRFNARTAYQLMGDLPKPRLTITRPFTHSGLDYAGPIQLRMNKGRGNKTFKGYIAIFVCLSTKAIHIEAVTDLTAQAFLAAFKRFTGRRGRISHLYSDNGTNFIAANKILQINSKKEFEHYKEKIQSSLTSIGTDWHFIPPASPHFGGLWEAGVKSIKGHLKRIIGNSTLTYEELTTVLAQIEACLNSRPLCPLTDDVDSLDVITPGHFLIGEPLLAPPEDPGLDQNINILTRWQTLEHMHRLFWRKWSTEYLTRLQERPKWTKPQANLQIGQLILIREDNMPPAQWAMGRIIETHPGQDGLTRVVTIQTKGGKIKRPVTKICKLPISEHDQEVETRNKEQPLQYASNLRNKASSSSSRKTLFAITLLMCFAIVLGDQTSQAFTIDPFKNNPGIYFDEIGRSNLRANDWNIIVYYDLLDYWKETNHFESYIHKLATLCGKLQNNLKEFCQATVTQFNHQLLEMSNKDNIIQSYSNFGNRSKRSLFDAGGLVASELFGVLDQRFAKRYEEDIFKVQNNEKHLLELLKNQTSIIESTRNIIRRDRITSQNQSDVINQQLKIITENLNQANIDMTEKTIFDAFIALTIQSMMSMLGYQNTQDALIDAILDVQHGKFSSNILTPEQLKAQLEVIRNNIPSSLKIPGNDITEIYRLMKIRTSSTRRTLIFNIQIPLLTTTTFQIFNLIPVPTKYLEEFVYIAPSSDYLMVNLKRDLFYPVKQNEFMECIQQKLDYYLCNQNHPLYTRESNISRCEMDLLNHEKALSSHCRLHRSESKKTWIQLHRKNKWIYVLDREYTIDVVCGDIIISTKLEGSGILTLRTGCGIKQSTIVIEAYQAYESHLNSSFSPNINISYQIQLNETHKIISLPPIQRGNVELAELDNAIEQIKQNQYLPSTINHHDIIHYSTSWCIIIILTIIILHLILKKFKKKPIPAPRHNVRTEDPNAFIIAE